MLQADIHHHDHFHHQGGCQSHFSILRSFFQDGVQDGRWLILKHTTTLFVLSDYYILSREWGVIDDQV